jgi:hypothetical protein
MKCNERNCSKYGRCNVKNMDRCPDKKIDTPLQDKLSDEQVQSWRKILLLQIGPYAMIMPPEEIQKIRDKMQSQFS